MEIGGAIAHQVDRTGRMPIPQAKFCSCGVGNMSRPSFPICIPVAL
ncbi:hypothetical protein [Microseira wollei]|nr:hypothetical protein [Microseira wollei]